jgi:hypothetical protein
MPRSSDLKGSSARTMAPLRLACDFAVGPRPHPLDRDRQGVDRSSVGAPDALRVGHEARWEHLDGSGGLIQDTFPLIALDPKVAEAVLGACERARGRRSAEPLVAILGSLPPTESSPRVLTHRERWREQVEALAPHLPSRIARGLREDVDARRRVIRRLRAEGAFPGFELDALHAAAHALEDLGRGARGRFRISGALAWLVDFHRTRVAGAGRLLEPGPGPWTFDGKSVPLHWMGPEHTAAAAHVIARLRRAGPPPVDALRRRVRDIWHGGRRGRVEVPDWRIEWLYGATVARLSGALRRYERFLRAHAERTGCGIAVGGL